MLAEWPDSSPGLLETMRAFEVARAQVTEDPGALPAGVITPYGHRVLREMAHTLRSPLGAIVMLAETLRGGQSGDLNDVQRDQLRIIHRAALSVASLVDDVLSITREDEEVPPHPVPFSIAELLGAVADLIRPLTDRRGIELGVDVAAPPERVGHPRALRRVMQSLALHTAMRARVGTIVLAAIDDRDGSTVFSVEGDADGLGVDEAFAAFRPAEDGAGYALSASGLGMGVARHLVRRMGAELAAEHTSADGLRLSFRVSLPRA
jgi:signal transduction histidine kinase